MVTEPVRGAIILDNFQSHDLLDPGARLPVPSHPQQTTRDKPGVCQLTASIHTIVQF